MDLRTKNILHTIRQGKIGGGESHVLSLVERLNQKQFKSVVVSFSDGPMVDALKERGIAVHVISTNTPFNPMITKELDEIIRKEEIDLLHAHGTRAASNSYRSAKKADIPLIYTVHGWSFHTDQPKLKYFTRKSSESFLVQQSNEVICVSKANLRLGETLFEMPQTSVIQNGVDFSRFNKQLDARLELRNEFGISDDAFCLSYIVRMTKQKDPLTMVKAIAIASKQQPKLRAIFVGDGDLRMETEAMAEELNCNSNISFVGFRSDIPEILSATDAYVLPSLWEGLPIGIIEAMAMSKAIIASDIEANAEVVKDGKTGLLVPTQSPEDLAKAILTLSKDAQLAKTLGQQAYEEASSNLQLSDMTLKVEEVYLRNLRQGRVFGRLVRRTTYEVPN